MSKICKQDKRKLKTIKYSNKILFWLWFKVHKVNCKIDSLISENNKKYSNILNKYD